MIDLTVLRAGVIVLLAVTCGAVFTVMRLYWMAWRRLPRTAGLVPLHVALVSLYVLINQGNLAWALIESFTAQATPSVATRVALFGVAALILLVALAVIGRLQHRKLQFARKRSTVVVHTADERSP